MGLLNPGGPIAQSQRNCCSISAVEVILLSGVRSLGHERVQTTMDTYSHLYPNKQTEVAAQLDVLATKDDGYEKTS